MNSLLFSTLIENKLFILCLALWELVWKGLALWKAVKSNQKYFFILILILNTLGLLPIGYLIYRRVLEKNAAQKTSVSK